MSLWQWVLVFFAGIAAGGINTVVGSGTLITFPTLVALGIPPVTANVSNAVGLFPGSLAGAWGYREELRGWRGRTIRLASGSILGAVGGATLLLVLPTSAFQTIAPVLITISLLLVLFGKQLNTWLAHRGHTPSKAVTPALWTATLLIGVYGGYFGAAQGVLMMGTFGLLMSGSVQHHNAMKNLLSGVSKLVATIVFIATAHIDWPVAGTIALGSIIGGLLGARIGRRLSPSVLRGIIVIVGLVAVVKLLA
ncbi:sulfite exporter TauE/SafE family protein [Leekyejoonella antrihumi]|uniref:Probable membrane transporter protein n=1 Tax=Leekyejoonella antrihumi TaxID=1660198 RepID=A0A563E3F4_9MICO|nr:sulfite exporter TauE/SafE family protein [Leekyejoonella antrihumi]TWP37048.1 sulfite exporter TauE/SafE family protein [Leekyejoonella antrihumi]